MLLIALIWEYVVKVINTLELFFHSYIMKIISYISYLFHQHMLFLYLIISFKTLMLILLYIQLKVHLFHYLLMYSHSYIN